MRKYYENYNEEYERGYEAGRRAYLRESINKDGRLDSVEDFEEVARIIRNNFKIYKDWVKGTSFRVSARLDIDSHKVERACENAFSKFYSKIKADVIPSSTNQGKTIEITSGNHNIEIQFRRFNYYTEVHLERDDEHRERLILFDGFRLVDNGKRLSDIEDSFLRGFDYSEKFDYCTNSPSVLEEQLDQLARMINNYIRR